MSSIDPSSARTAEDFVLLLRQARAMSELSFWQLEQAANAAGHDLEPAVLAEALGRGTLPDDQLVVALLHACGYPDEQVERWLQIRDRLALAIPTSVPYPVPHSVPHSVFHESTAQLPETPSSVPDAGPSSVRARHSLRLPGRGARRAPGSRLRPLVTAAVAVLVGVAGIVGIAVIVSAVNDGDGDDRGAGSTIYRGVPQPTGPAEPPPSDLPSSAPSPSPSVPASPSPSPTAAPPIGVLRSGTATLQTGQGIDLDGGGSDHDIIVFGDGDAIRADPSSRHFALEPTAAKQSCATAEGYQKTMQGLTAGAGVCVRTDKGAYAHITVTRTAPLGFSYVVWS